MANPPVWDARLQFEQYVYDYMKKMGRTEAAEIFRRETNLPIDPRVPPEIDVPDGFLHEWWLTFYDHYKAWDTKDHQHHEGFSAKDIHMMNMRKQIDPAVSKQNELNEQMIKELNINSDFGLTIARASAPSMSTRLSSTDSDKKSQAFTSTPPLGDNDAQAVNHYLTHKTGKTASSKEGRRKKGSVPPTDGRSNEKPGANSSHSEASSEGSKDQQGVTNRSLSHGKGKKAARGGSSRKNDKTAELSSSRAKGKGDGAGNGEGDASSNSEDCHSDKDDMRDVISLGGILEKLMFPSDFYIICLLTRLSWELELLKDSGSSILFVHQQWNIICTTCGPLIVPSGFLGLGFFIIGTLLMHGRISTQILIDFYFRYFR